MRVKDVTITIQGKPAYEGQDEEAVQLITQGTLAIGEKAGHYDLTYEETELTGMQGTTTTFKITPKRILLMRSGPVNNQMLFEEGRRHTALYATPYGQMQVGVCARHVRNSMGDCGGDMEIDFSIDIDHAMAGENSLYVNVREATLRQ